MSLIEIKNLTFGYDNGTDNIFDDVSFTLDTSWHTGLAGRNGRGKTTLMNLMLGRYEYRGRISADVNFQYFPFEVEDENSPAIDLVTDISHCEDWQARRELGLLGVSEDSFYLPFALLSKGQQTKVMLAALFLKENGFLLIDEPTNHLDTAGRQQLAKYLQTKSGYIIVSHDRVFLDGCTDHTLYIGRNDIMLQKCSFLQFWENMQKQDKYEQDRNKTLKKDIKRLEASFKQSESWSAKAEKGKYKTADTQGMLDRGFMGHKAEKMMQSAKNIQARQQKAIEEKQSLLKNSEFSEDLKLAVLPLPPKGFYCENVAVSYPGKPLIDNLSFSIKQGDRLLIKGGNGTGKTSLFNCIAGLRNNYSGIIYRQNGIVISYLTQDTSFLKGSIWEYVDKNGLDRALFGAIMRKLDFSRSLFETDMSTYSQGQKKKVLVAASLSAKAHIYLWDEPLNYLDLYCRNQLENLLVSCKPTMIFSEHDAAFCDAVATNIIEL